MARREFDDKTVIERKYYSIAKIIMLSICGGIFVTLGIAMFVTVVNDIIKNVQNGMSFDFSILLFGIITLMFFGFGGGALYFALKDVYNWIMLRLTKKRGDECEAVIMNKRGISQGGKAGPNINRYFGFDLSYVKDGVQKRAKTDTIYDINEMRYLTSLPQVKVKVYKNYVVIDEEFRYEIYKVDSRYGLDKKYFTEKPFSTILKIWRIVCLLSIALFIGLFALTIVLKVNAYAFVGFGLLTFLNLAFGIAYAICFFRNLPH